MVWKLLSVLLLYIGPPVLLADIPSQITRENRSGFESELLIAIAISESGLSPSKVGRTGDYGLFQITEIAYLDALLECPAKLKATSFPDSLLDPKWAIRTVNCYIRAVNKRNQFRSIAELLAYYNCGTVCFLQVRNKQVRKLNTTTKDYLLETLITLEEERNKK
jgi:hypothetical protein